MSAVRKTDIDFSKCDVESSFTKSPLHLIQGPFSSKKVSRHSPVLGGLHKATDGALVGVLTTAAMMSALALHSQYLWTIAFSRLETTRELTHRLTESTAVLERYLLKSTTSPVEMVPTKVANLLYLDGLTKESFPKLDTQREGLFWLKVFNHPINHGY